MYYSPQLRYQSRSDCCATNVIYDDTHPYPGRKKMHGYNNKTKKKEKKNKKRSTNPISVNFLFVCGAVADDLRFSARRYSVSINYY